jgi:hypothetical protein
MPESRHRAQVYSVSGERRGRRAAIQRRSAETELLTRGSARRQMKEVSDRNSIVTCRHRQKASFETASYSSRPRRHPPVTDMQQTRAVYDSRDRTSLDSHNHTMTTAPNCCVLRHTIFILLFWVGGAVLIAGCASTPATKAPVTIGQVIEMSRNGTDAPSIIAKMRETGTVYRLPGSSVAMLEGEGVPAPVLDYMLQTRSQAERAQADECFKWIWCVMGPPYFVVK